LTKLDNSYHKVKFFSIIPEWRNDLARLVFQGWFLWSVKSNLHNVR